MILCELGDIKRVKKLLSGRFGLELLKVQDTDSFTPFALAVKQQNLEMVKVFIEFYEEIGAKGDINLTDRFGFNILHTAFQYSSEEIVMLLLSIDKVDVHIKNNDNNTPLHFFCQCYSYPNVQEVLDLFLKKGAQIDARNTNGETPLHKVTVLVLWCALIMLIGNF